MDKKIFKAYDIRGIYPDQLDEEAAYNIGKGFAAFLIDKTGKQKLKVAVGSDMRLSSPALKARVIDGLLESGLDVDDLGLVSTPTYYFVVAKFGYDGGIQVSASHNPRQFNGMKIVEKGGVALGKANGLMEIHDRIEHDQFAVASEQGMLLQREAVVNDLIADQVSMVDISQIKPFKIVIDAMDAMGSTDMGPLFAKLPCEIVKMNFKPDGSFPAYRSADPMPAENMRVIRSRVVEEKADLGIAIDGDGDRYFFFDEKGEELPQAILRGLMAQIALQESPGATVIYDVRPGKITKDMIDEVGGKSIPAPVGHTIIKEWMIRENAVFGGESSGHHFFKLPYGTFEAPVLLVLRLLKHISEKGKSLSEIVAPYKRYSHSGEINLEMEDRAEIEAKIEEIKQKYSDGHQFYIDGLSVEYPEYWFSLRASNTEPMIRFTLEAVNPQLMAEKRDEILQLLVRE
jgi:phosphomannomutase